MDQNDWNALNGAYAFAQFLGAKSEGVIIPSCFGDDLSALNVKMESHRNGIITRCTNAFCPGYGPNSSFILISNEPRMLYSTCVTCGHQYYLNVHTTRVRPWINTKWGRVREGTTYRLRLKPSSWIMHLDGCWIHRNDTYGFQECVLYGKECNYAFDFLPWSLADLWEDQQSPGQFWHSNIKNVISWRRI